MKLDKNEWRKLGPDEKIEGSDLYSTGEGFVAQAGCIVGESCSEEIGQTVRQVQLGSAGVWSYYRKKETEFKVGDRVRVLVDRPCGSIHRRGDVGVILRTDGPIYEVSSERGDSRRWVNSEHIEPCPENKIKVPVPEGKEFDSIEDKGSEVIVSLKDKGPVVGQWYKDTSMGHFGKFNYVSGEMAHLTALDGNSFAAYLKHLAPIEPFEERWILLEEGEVIQKEDEYLLGETWKQSRNAVGSQQSKWYLTRRRKVKVLKQEYIKF